MQPWINIKHSLFQHTKQFCGIDVKPWLYFHPYASVWLNCRVRSGNMIYDSSDCLTPTAPAERLHEFWLWQLNWESVWAIGKVRKEKVNREIARYAYIWHMYSMYIWGQVWLLCSGGPLHFLGLTIVSMCTVQQHWRQSFKFTRFSTWFNTCINRLPQGTSPLPWGISEDLPALLP